DLGRPRRALNSRLLPDHHRWRRRDRGVRTGGGGRGAAGVRRRLLRCTPHADWTELGAVRGTGGRRLLRGHRRLDGAGAAGDRRRVAGELSLPPDRVVGDAVRSRRLVVPRTFRRCGSRLGAGRALREHVVLLCDFPEPDDERTEGGDLVPRADRRRGLAPDATAPVASRSLKPACEAAWPACHLSRGDRWTSRTIPAPAPD